LTRAFYGECRFDDADTMLSTPSDYAIVITPRPCPFTTSVATTTLHRRHHAAFLPRHSREHFSAIVSRATDRAFRFTPARSATPSPRAARGLFGDFASFMPRLRAFRMPCSSAAYRCRRAARATIHASDGPPVPCKQSQAAVQIGFEDLRHARPPTPFFTREFVRSVTLYYC